MASPLVFGSQILCRSCGWVCQFSIAVISPSSLVITCSSAADASMYLPYGDDCVAHEVVNAATAISIRNFVFVLFMLVGWWLEIGADVRQFAGAVICPVLPTGCKEPDISTGTACQ